MRSALCSLDLCTNCVVTYVEGQHLLRRLFVFMIEYILEVGESVNAENRWPPKLVSVRAECLG